MPIQEAIIYKLVELAFLAAETAIERQAVIARIKELEEQGKTPDELADALKAMRDEAIGRL